MPRRNRREQPKEELPDALRAYDGRGNVRPADDRFLTDTQIEVKDAFVEENTDEETKVAQEIVDAVATKPLEEPAPGNPGYVAAGDGSQGALDV